MRLHLAGLFIDDGVKDFVHERWQVDLRCLAQALKCHDMATLELKYHRVVFQEKENVGNEQRNAEHYSGNPGIHATTLTWDEQCLHFV